MKPDSFIFVTPEARVDRAHDRAEGREPDPLVLQRRERCNERLAVAEAEEQAATPDEDRVVLSSLVRPGTAGTKISLNHRQL